MTTNRRHCPSISVSQRAHWPILSNSACSKQTRWAPFIMKNRTERLLGIARHLSGVILPESAMSGVLYRFFKKRCCDPAGPELRCHTAQMLNSAKLWEVRCSAVNRYVLNIRKCWKCLQMSRTPLRIQMRRKQDCNFPRRAETKLLFLYKWRLEKKKALLLMSDWIKNRF